MVKARRCCARWLRACLAALAVVILVVQVLLLRAAHVPDGVRQAAGGGSAPLPTLSLKPRQGKRRAPLQSEAHNEPSRQVPLSKSRAGPASPAAPVSVQEQAAGATIRRAELLAELRQAGEALGSASSARLAIVMPVRDSNVPSALRNVKSWALRRRPPCLDSADASARPGQSSRTLDHESDVGAAASPSDFAFLHSQSFSSHDASRGAADLDAELRRPGGGGACFGAVRRASTPRPAPLEGILPTFAQVARQTGSLKPAGAIPRGAHSARAGCVYYHAHAQLLRPQPPLPRRVP